MPHTRIAFSTVTCPEWTLDHAAEMAGRWGFDGVELRTRGFGSTEFACDPALTSAEKVRSIFEDAGIAAACLATTLVFDEPVRPKVLGYVIGDHEGPMRQAKRMIDLATQIDCPLVRVFGFAVQAGATRAETENLIEARLRMVVDHADKTGVRVALENGGSFPTAQDLMAILERIDSPLLVASYSAAVAARAGEAPAEGLRRLTGRIGLVKVREAQVEGPGMEEVARLASGTADWVVFEHDRAFVPDLATPEATLPLAAKRLFGAIATGRGAPAGPAFRLA